MLKLENRISTCYFGSIFLIVWTLCAFRQRSNIGHFQQFFIINFDQMEILNSDVLSERSSSDLPDYTLYGTAIS